VIAMPRARTVRKLLVVVLPVLFVAVSGCGENDANSGGPKSNTASAHKRPKDLPAAECYKSPCATEEELADAVAVTAAILVAASRRDGAGVCRHASETLLKLISDDPAIPVSQAECAAWVPGSIDSNGDPPAPGAFAIPSIGFQRMSDGVTEKGWSAYVHVTPRDDSTVTATANIQQEADGVWRLWQCCDFVPKAR
jgi:hypothetical protein